ncbi:unnamed protein product [Pedinophyceae sp. YPF-701]|nr:unnamed protein product [Pedinophyceae sp. YPF-701]
MDGCIGGVRGRACAAVHARPPAQCTRARAPRFQRCFSIPKRSVRRPNEPRREQGHPLHRAMASSPAAPRTADVAHASALLEPLDLGPGVRLESPLILAPMAGYTSWPLRQLCFEYGAEMCTSEMIIASTLLDRSPRAQHLARMGPDEHPRSVQLYGIDPARMRDAAKLLATEHGAQHIDINLGCPVRKVTARGGGAALTVRWGLVGRLVAATVAGAGPGVAVTIKTRLGISDDLLTFKETAAAARDAGAAAVTLHARTAEQLYAPPARWGGIRELQDSLGLPVIGNGDVRGGHDAVRMVQETGCRGVMVGRAALGRPWVFREVAAALRGQPAPPPPALAEVVAVAQQHVHGLADWEGDELTSVLKMRSLVPLYLLGFPSAAELRKRLQKANSLGDWEAAIAVQDWDPKEAPDPAAAAAARLKGKEPEGYKKKVALPPGWLDSWGGTEDVEGGTDDACEG